MADFKISNQTQWNNYIQKLPFGNKDTLDKVHKFNGSFGKFNIWTELDNKSWEEPFGFEENGFDYKKPSAQTWHLISLDIRINLIIDGNILEIYI